MMSGLQKTPVRVKVVYTFNQSSDKNNKNLRRAWTYPHNKSLSYVLVSNIQRGVSPSAHILDTPPNTRTWLP